MKSVKILKRGLFISLMLLALVGILMFTLNGTSANAVSAKTSGTQVYYENYTWLGKWREQIVIDGRAANSSTTYENRKEVASLSNWLSCDIQSQYNVSEKKGHNFTAKVKAKSSYFEAEAGYSFSKEVITQTNNSFVVKPKQSVKVYSSDIRVKRQFFDVARNKQQHYWKWGVGIGYHHDYFMGWEDEIVREYSGSHVDVVYA